MRSELCSCSSAIIEHRFTCCILRISRDEAEEINRVVMSELDTVVSGCTSTIVGG